MSTIRDDLTLKDPRNRQIRLITIGAGVAGVLMAYRVQKECENVEHTIYEKNNDIGGTWLENQYPGCACDIPSHAYTYPFALDPEWPRFFSESKDIWQYLNRVCDCFALRKHMRFGTEVIDAQWNARRGEWKVKTKCHATGVEAVDVCDLLILGTGIFNNYKWPVIPGLHDAFKGRVIHPSRWPQEYQAEQWAGQHVTVIGSGSTSIQVVPELQKHAKRLDVFVRTGVWFGNIGSNTGINKEYSDAEIQAFRQDPDRLVHHAKTLENEINGVWGAFYRDTKAQETVREMFRDHMATVITDERLLKGFMPDFGVGCRRISPGDIYMKAVQESNVEVHFTGVKECTKNAVVGNDGVSRKADTIICATGFDSTYRPRFSIRGQGGVDLKEKWSKVPECYLGVAIPEFPNLLMFIGPTWPIENGSVMGPLYSVSSYAIKMIKKMQTEDILSWVPKQGITDRFNEHVQSWIQHTVWKDDCRSWYKDNESGRVNAIWPGSSLHYQQTIETPRFEDFEIKYFNNNEWGFLGMGWTMQDRERARRGNADVSPYLNKEHIDPLWWSYVTKLK